MKFRAEQHVYSCTDENWNLYFCIPERKLPWLYIGGGFKTKEKAKEFAKVFKEFYQDPEEFTL